jgi:hypothetical protein
MSKDANSGARAVSRPRHISLALVLGWLLAGAACGPVLYTTEVDSAESVVAQARERNARWYAPYEYYYAEAHLKKAREEAATSDYEDAIRFAKVATEYGQRALRVAERQEREVR